MNIGELGTLSNFTDIGTTAASSIGTTVTASSSANTKGTYTQLVASTSFPTSGILIGANNNPATGQNTALDIAIGGLGSEQVIISNLMIPNAVSRKAESFFIPYNIPSASRIAARIQSDSGSSALSINAIYAPGDFIFPSYNISDTYGFTAATTLGTAVDPGGTANTKGSFAQITSSTNREHTGIMWCFDNQQESLVASANMLVDIAVGAAASEQVIIPNIITSISTNLPLEPWSAGCVIPIRIPAATRLSARCQSTNNTALTRKIGVTLYCFS